jgi:hypothetical protein
MSKGLPHAAKKELNLNSLPLAIMLNGCVPKKALDGLKKYLNDVRYYRGQPRMEKHGQLLQI